RNAAGLARSRTTAATEHLTGLSRISLTALSLFPGLRPIRRLERRSAHDLDRIAAADPQRLGRRRTVHRDLYEPGAPDDQERRPRDGSRVGRADFPQLDLATAAVDSHRAVRQQRLGEVGDAVPEPVHVENAPANPIPTEVWLQRWEPPRIRDGWAEGGRIHPASEGGAQRRKDITAVKSRAHRRSKEAPLGDLADHRVRLPIEEVAEHTVV